MQCQLLDRSYHSNFQSDRFHFSSRWDELSVGRIGAQKSIYEKVEFGTYRSGITALRR